ncbi:MAG TPA: HAMP domain-containing protein, partial [Candidatus Kapabacteria bacterium]|nr:HAMP domain-containing protein [Candidatus Kapabacteria bacterium]
IINKISYDRFPKTIWSNNIIDALNGAGQVIRDVIIINDTLTYKEELKKLDGYANIVVAMLDSLNRTITSEKGKEILNKLSMARENYVEARKKVLDAINKHNFSEASKFLFSELEKPQADYIKYANEMISFQLEQVNEANIEADDIYKTSMLLLIIIVGISVIISILIALIITRGITKPIKLTVDAANKLAEGNTNIKLETKSKDETAILINAMNNMANSISSLVNDANQLGKAAISGKLDVRADASKYSGDYKNLINGINGTLDAVIGPLNVAAEYVDRISKGDIPPRITDDYKGDFNEIKNNLNGCMDAINLLIQDSKFLANAAINGKLDIRADVTKHQGDFRAIIQGVNNTLDNVIGPLNVAAEYVDRISKGDIPPNITDDYKGDFNEIKNNINSCIDNLNLLGSDIRVSCIASLEGKLDVRADITKHQGVYRKIVNGFNDTLDSVIGPLNVAAEYVERISKGDIPPRITDEYKGDFNEIKNNINQLIDNITVILKGVNRVGESIKNGNLQDKGDAEIFQGDWKKIVSGINNIIDSFIAPLSITSNYIERISKGDIPLKINTEYNGDFNEIKNNINGCIDAINLLIQDSKYLASSAINGKLDTRADAIKHQGDFRKIIEGVNDTLDAVIGPLNVAAEYVDRISKGDIPPKITEEYKGDFNEIKNNLNSCIDGLQGLVEAKNILANIVINDYTKNVTGNYLGIFAEVADSVNSILIKLRGITSLCIEVSNGDLRQIDDLRKEGKRCEFDNLNPSLLKMMEAIQELVSETVFLANAGAEGKLDVRGDTSKFKGEYVHVVEGFNKTMDNIINPLNEAGQVLSIYASGDLTPKMVGEYKGDLALYKDNINTLGESLSNVIREVLDAVQSTASSAIQISSTAETMAVSAEEQSKQADEVASAVEEMSRTITENAMNAGKTADVAEKNGNIANEGGLVVERTVDKMRDIAKVVKQSADNMEKLGESSKQIGEIISVI